MKPYPEFKALNCPLSGKVLVEASAGTGKTFAITRIFLRLLLELEHLSVKDILVVTYTEAATQELRNRLRKTLREALDVMNTPDAADSDLKAICARQAHDPKARERLRAAIRDFDEAAIYTIHGFCHRVLADFAFETGKPFDTQLITDQEPLLHEITLDFWRLNFCGESGESLLFIGYLNGMRGFLEMAAQLKPYRGRHGVRILPETPPVVDKSAAEDAYRTAFDQARTIWMAEHETITNILRQDPGLNRNQYKLSSLPGKAADMNSFLKSGSDGFPDKDESTVLEYFSAGKITRSVKKGFTAPRHPFFDACEALKQAYQQLAQVFGQYLVGLRRRFFDYLRQELEKRHQERNTQGFDELLLGVHRAISGEHKDLLVENINRRYQAALIDEFQDTDPIQYDIFTAFFQQAPLFFIGDPKQAIYGFRGADIFSYLKAAADAQRDRYPIFTLTRNWRSTPKLVKIVNLFFRQVAHPFVFEKIQFFPGAVGRRKTTAEPLEVLMLEEMKGLTPVERWRRQFYLWHFELDAKSGWKQGEAAKRVAALIAGEIARLVSLGREGRAKIGERPLREEDIAVIVRRNREAEEMRKALAALNIPAVLHGAENVLDAPEALDLERILCAAAFPHDERSVKAALITDLIGVDGNELDRLLKSESDLDAWFDKFREYGEQWRTHGFMRMFSLVMSSEKVRPHLTALDNGERRITNVLHLAEIIHRQATERHLSPLETLKWFRAQRDPSAVRQEENLLRLSTDDNAVRLVTVHKSKGLEYPVVFLPFMWRNFAPRSSDILLFHHPAHQYETTLDLGSPQLTDHLPAGQQEQLSENLRQFYVALTRAKHRCYLVMPTSDKPLHSATDYLIQPDAEAFLQRLAQCAQVSPIPAELTAPPGLPLISAKTIRRRKFGRRIEQRYRISSFSSLALRRDAEFHEPERDPEAVTEPPPEEPEPEFRYSIHNFPRGATAGTFLHELFELIDFTDYQAPWVAEAIMKKLADYGYDPAWQAPLAVMLRNVLTVPLDPDNPAFTLSAIDQAHRITEMGFYFPLRKITPEGLSRLFSPAYSAQLPAAFPQMIENLEFSPVAGYMKGFIDLVFQFAGRYYLLDWKSNYLGPKISDYGSDQMLAAMSSHYYILQYLIYTVALDQYLRYRVPGYRYETHFGGVRYLFLRGIDPHLSAECGVCRSLPEARLIAALNQGLIQADGR